MLFRTSLSKRSIRKIDRARVIRQRCNHIMIAEEKCNVNSPFLPRPSLSLLFSLSLNNTDAIYIYVNSVNMK